MDNLEGMGHSITLSGRPIAYPRTRRSATTGVPILTPQYRQWLRTAGYEIRSAINRGDLEGLGDAPVSIELIVDSDEILVSIRPLADTLQYRPKHLRGDLDNYAKSVLDAAQLPLAGWINNDRQVVRLLARFSPRVAAGEATPKVGAGF